MSGYGLEDSTAVRQLARQIRALQRETRALARAAQGPRRSVDISTGGTTYYAEDGTPLMQVGVGEDGEFGFVNVDPTPPPTPEAPDVIPAISGIKIVWDGTFVDANWTTNMAYVEVHVSNVADFVADDTTQVTTFASPSGGEFVYATPNDSTDKYVALVAVSISGVESEKSIEAVGAGLIVNAEVSAAIDELIAQVENNTQEIATSVADYQNLAVTTQTLVDQTASLDGRVSTSDYDPGVEDVAGRTDGSIWFARTRPRTNLCTNPSFEVNANDWYPSLTSLARVADTGPVDGGFVLEVTNDATNWYHLVAWGPALGGALCSPGQTWTASIYAKLVSGDGVGYLAQLWWYDEAGNPLPAPDNITNGVYQDIVVDSWTRLTVTGVAPANAAKVVIVVTAPPTAPNAVWRLDACLVELSNIVGSYFDGSSYDCRWDVDTAPNNTTSTMTGDKIVRFFELDENAWFGKKFSGAVLVDIDASTITTGYMDGERIQDNSIPIDKISALPATAGEDLAAGDMVNIYSVDGIAFVRKADADAGRACHGFVTTAVANGGLALVYNFGYIVGLASMPVGARYLGATPGQSASAPPIIVGSVSQRVGVAITNNVMMFNPTSPIFVV